MRRFPDFPGLAARGLLVLSLTSLCAGAVWLVRANDSRESPRSHAERETSEEKPPFVAATAEQPDLDEVLDTGQKMWERYVPAEIRERYTFPTMEELQAFLARLEGEMAEGSSVRLASYERDARRALKLLRRHDGGDVLAAWLEPRLDILTAAAQIERTAVRPQQDDLPDTDTPDAEPELAPEAKPLPEVQRSQFTRGYWDRVLGRRPPPRRAAEYVPRLKEIFQAAGLPPELVWIAEVESAMNPEAISPAGARGLFQFMPLTAARFGLEAGLLVDERNDPEKSARAAADYLRVLHRRFQSWPLAIAAYNAGEGRVGRALAAENVSTFDEVAHRLPLETRMYVPKVLAAVAVRESIDPDSLPPPKAREASQARFVSDKPSATAEAEETASSTSL